MTLSDDVRELLCLYDWEDVRGAFKPARFLPVPDKPLPLRPKGKLVFRSELPNRLLPAYDVAISEGLVEQYLLEPENQLPLYKSMGWPVGMPDVPQNKPWPLVPDWSDALVVITPKGRGVLAKQRDGKTDDPPVEDGPIDPNGFAWDGNIYRGLREKAFLAVKHLWGRRDRTASALDLAEPVWGDHELEPDKNQLGGTRRDINSFLRKHKVPLHAKMGSIDGLSYLSLLDGLPPSRSKRKVAKGKRR